jgi:hypothetical protein
MKKRKKRDWIGEELPIVAELKDCRQLSDDHWQGIDFDGTLVDVKGGRMPKRLLAFRGGALVGIIRVTPA